MTFDKEFLDAELKSIRDQKEHFARLLQQAIGAEGALMAVLARYEAATGSNTETETGDNDD